MGFLVILGLVLLGFVGYFVSKFANDSAYFTRIFAARAAHKATSIVKYIAIGGLILIVLLIAKGCS